MNRTCRVCGEVFRCKGHLRNSCKNYLTIKVCACASCCLDVTEKHIPSPLKRFKKYYADCFYITRELVDEWLFRKMVGRIEDDEKV